MIEIRFEGAQIQSVLRKLKAQLGNLSEPMHDAGQYMMDSVKQRFATSTAPDGSKWAERKPSTITAILDRRKGSRKKDGSISAVGQRFLAGRSPLRGDGALEGSIAYESDASSATLKAGGLPYAAAHQFGGKPYVIKPKNKKALAFNGIVRKRVQHPGQTARPYMGFSDENRSEIMQILKSHLSS